MTSVPFADLAAGVRIEIDPTEGSKGPKPSYESVLVAIAAMAERLGTRVNAMEPDDRPAKLEIEFGLSALGTGELTVTQGSTEANFRVVLTWSSTPAGLDLVPTGGQQV